MKIKAVIGAAYGDEGKGLMTDYLASKALSEGQRPAVIRFNGGAQAGHTVTTPEGVSHVFHHIGSAAMLDVDTYLTEDFLVNPIVLDRELEELRNKDVRVQTIFVHPAARFTTPFDMVLNQVLENQRQSKQAQHGSCGMGIFETMQRYKVLSNVSVSIGQFSSMDEQKKRDHLKQLVEQYYAPRAYSVLEGDYLERALVLLQRQDLVEQFFDGWEALMNSVAMTTTFMEQAADDRTLIFEGAQGLMLDQRHKNFPHVTPSNTGTQNIVQQLKKIPEHRLLDIEAVYVTRSYVTRHGAGPLKHELQGAPFLVYDPTNVPNPYQETLRYAHFDRDIYEEEITTDLKRSDIAGWSEDGGHKFKVSTAMSCLDQAMASDVVKWHAQDKEITNTGPEYVAIMKHLFDYCSFGPSRAAVRTHEELNARSTTPSFREQHGRPFNFDGV